MRRPKSSVIALACALGVIAVRAQAANDPTIDWKSLETPHFRVNYYTGEKEIAERMADVAESVYARLVPAVGWPPSQRVELSIVDQTDSANAFASALPYDSIRFFATAPDDLSPLGDVDDWYVELVTHEFTHVLHTDHIRGVPAIVNAILGKTLAPNQVQPRFILEGLAVFEESSKTSGGRLRSSIWNMFMRTDVLEDNVAPLDVFANTARRWPQGNLWYLYGSFFMQWIAQTYGEQAIRTMIDDYGHQLIPYGVNRSMRRATGRTYEELYPAWVDTLKRDFGAQAAAVRARGLREGTRITFGGQTAQSPRIIPNNAWPGAAGDVLYYRDDGHDTAGLYRVPLRRDAKGALEAPKDRDAELFVRSSGNAVAAFAPDGALVFDSVDFHQNLIPYNDLFVMPRGVKSTTGMDGTRQRLTDGLRATQPDVSPDGRRVVFVTNLHGTTSLEVGDLDPARTGLTNVHDLVRSKQFDQAYAPRWSPDDRHVAYSVWQKGGYRDVRIVDTVDGSVRDLTHDRAMDGGPVFSPDGKTVYFHSDRTGIMNIYAFDLATGVLKQVTNVLTGAFEPVLSADGRTLVYLGYTKGGYDLFAMDVAPDRFLDALPYVDDRPAPAPEPLHIAYPVKEYNPLGTLLPRRYQLNTAPGSWGQEFSVAVASADIAGRHALSATLSLQTGKPSPEIDVGYTYGRLPFDLSLHAYRAIAPGGGLAYGNVRKDWVVETVGASSAINYQVQGPFDTHGVSLTYSFNRIGGSFGEDPATLDPYDTPHYPSRPLAGILSLAWSYSNAQRFLWSVSAEKGYSVSTSLDLTHPALASDYRGYRARADFTTYVGMPWLRHHALALHASGGFGGGSFPGGPFYVGGFVDVAWLDQLRSAVQSANFLVQGGVALRGYPVAVQTGAYYALLNAEYRFPIVNLDRGPSTLPIFLNRVSGNVFVDYGSAFNAPETAQFKTGVGAELWLDFTVGYFLSLMMRVGYAKGLASQGLDKVYFVASVPY